MLGIAGLILFFWLGYMWYITLTHLYNKFKDRKK